MEHLWYLCKVYPWNENELSQWLPGRTDKHVKNGSYRKRDHFWISLWHYDCVTDHWGDTAHKSFRFCQCGARLHSSEQRKRRFRRRVSLACLRMYIHQTLDFIYLLVHVVFASTSSLHYDVIVKSLAISSKDTPNLPQTPSLFLSSNPVAMDPSNKPIGPSPHYSLYQRQIFKAGGSKGQCACWPSTFRYLTDVFAKYPVFPSTRTSSQNQQRRNWTTAGTFTRTPTLALDGLTERIGIPDRTLNYWTYYWRCSLQGSILSVENYPSDAREHEHSRSQQSVHILTQKQGMVTQ